MTATLSKRDKLTAIVGAVVAVGILLYTFVMAPCVKRWQTLGTELDIEQRKLARLREQLEERDTLVTSRDKYSAIMGSVLGPEAYPERNEKPKDEKPKDEKAQKESAPEGKPDAETQSSAEKESQAKGEPEKNGNKEPPASKKVSLMAHVERVAKKSGVKLNRLTRGKPVRSAKKAPKFTAVGLRLSFDTQVQQLTKFLYALEHGDRLVRVERTDIRRDLKKPKNIQVTLNVVGYEYASGK